MREHPNILFILTDQQNSTMLSCAGNRYLATPAMDSLAVDGVRFTRAYCTNPVCVPSRFSLMTGQMPSVVGLRSNRASHIDGIPESIRHSGLGWCLRETGYDVAYAGTVGLPHLSAAAVGFEYLGRDERDQLPEICADFIHRKRNRPFCLVASFINPHDICYLALRDSQQTEAEQRIIQRGVIECQTLDAALTRPRGVDDTTFFCPALPAAATELRAADR